MTIWPKKSTPNWDDIPPQAPNTSDASTSYELEDDLDETIISPRKLPDINDDDSATETVDENREALTQEIEELANAGNWGSDMDSMKRPGGFVLQAAAEPAPYTPGEARFYDELVITFGFDPLAA